MSHAIIAVGYRLTFPDDLKGRIDAGLLAAERPIDLADFSISHVVTAGVLYGRQCKGGLDDVKADPEELQAWYQRRMGKVYKALVRSIYVSSRPNVIMASVTVQSTNPFVFIEPFNIDATAYLWGT